MEEIDPKRGPRPTVVLAAFSGLVVLVAALAWYAARSAAGSGSAAPPAPPIPANQLITVPAPVEAPAIELPTADGRRFSLATARGQVVVVNFWATWCQPCLVEMPSIVQLGRELAERHPGKFRVVAVSVDDAPNAVRQFFSAPPYAGLPAEVALALEPGVGEVTRAYHCRGRGACRPEEVTFPETYVVDRQGNIVAMVVGVIDWSTPGVRQYLEALLARRP